MFRESPPHGGKESQCFFECAKNTRNVVGMRIAPQRQAYDTALWNNAEIVEQAMR